MENESIFCRPGKTFYRLMPLAPVGSSCMASCTGSLFQPQTGQVSFGPGLGGCWAAGPCFREGPGMAGAKAKITLDAALSRLGLGVRETTALELSLKRQGGVWLSVQGSASRAMGLEKSLRRLEDVDVKRFSIR